MNLLPHDVRGRMIAQMCWSELEKIASAAGAPPVPVNSGEMVGGVQQGPSVDAEPASPAHGVVASRVEQLDSKRAVGIPVIQAPPGFVYAPELTAFVPNEQDPGWMPPEVAAKAAQNKGWYDRGQEELGVQKAQQELDGQVSADAEAAAGEQQQQQATAQQDQAMMAGSKQKAMDQVAKQEMGLAAPKAGAGPKTPSHIAGKKKSSPQKQKNQSGPGGNKGVTIKIGR